MKQLLLVPITENESLDREYLVDLGRQVEEEMVWRVQLNNREDCQDLVQSAEAFERATRNEKADIMQFAFQLKNGMMVVELAGYENKVAKWQAHEK